MPKIIGNPTVTPMAVPDWLQDDPLKADFIKNKPIVNLGTITDLSILNSCIKEGVYVYTYDTSPPISAARDTDCNNEIMISGFYRHERKYGEEFGGSGEFEFEFEDVVQTRLTVDGVYQRGGVHLRGSDWEWHEWKNVSPVTKNEIDQTYSPTSENAQSGKAVAEAIADIQVSGGAVQSDWNEENPASLAHILNKPNIPTKISDLVDDTEVAERIKCAKEAQAAYQDGKGNLIHEAYATKEELEIINEIATDAHSRVLSAEQEISTVEAIAKGRATGYVFDTVEDMNEWLAQGENVSKLVLGDNLYIRAVDVPDYWWDNKSLTAQPLETQKVDLSEYAKKDSVPAKIRQLIDDTEEEFPINYSAEAKHAREADNAVFASYSEQATIATHDGEDNIIHETYATKNELGDIDAALDESIALCDSYISWEVPV